MIHVRFLAVMPCVLLTAALPLVLGEVAPAELAVQRVGAGFSRPVSAAAPPGDTNRLFVVEQHTGRIRILNLTTLAIEGTPWGAYTNVVVTEAGSATVVAEGIGEVARFYRPMGSVPET